MLMTTRHNENNRNGNGGRNGAFDGSSAIGLPLVQWERLCREILGEPEHVALIKAWVQPLGVLEEAVSITDAENNHILYVNRAWRKLYGYSAAEVVGKTPGTILTPDRYSQRVLQRVIVATHKGGWEGELLNCDKTGNLFTVHLRTSPLRAPNGQLICMLGIAKHADSTNGHSTNGHSTNGHSTNGNGTAPWMKAMGKLTPRELEVFAAFGQGQSTDEVGRQMGVSIFTVQTHRTRIKEKLGMRNNTAMCRLAFEWVASGH